MPLLSTIALLAPSPAHCSGQPYPTAATRARAILPPASLAGYVAKNGPAEYLKAMNKYGAAPSNNTATVADAAAAASGQMGTVSANPEQYDEAYLCPVTIGTPGIQTMLDFDTGSADLWVFSTLMPSSQSSGHSPLYNPSGSSTAVRETGETWSISYGDGSGASGVVYADKVVIGAVTATSQAVEAATSVSSTFQADRSNNGLVGLAMSSINTASPKQVTTFFDTVKSSLASPLFTATLKKGKGGQLRLRLHRHVKVHRQHHLHFTSYSTSIGDRYAPSSFTTVHLSLTTQSIADTGTTLLLLPASVCKNYYSKVSGSSNSATYGGYVFPCSATLPSFSVTIGGTTHTVPGSYFNYAPVNAGSITCYGGLQSSASVGINIFGDIFLKSQFVVFSSSGPQLGFAQQAS
ncbi:hypothetical protein MRB53_039547 [Persea americana]|nr:hypothetical protein MRB53_039547 [Persea americana]